MSTPAKPRFTPGPWKRSGDDVFAGDVAVHLGEPLSVVRDYDERAANARLIAASPSLYAYAKAEELHKNYIDHLHAGYSPANGHIEPYAAFIRHISDNMGWKGIESSADFLIVYRATALALAEGKQ